jgi:5-formaminoimidazole-4-carboxamide-1-beta-D-ribofuranosyl 5'-monophosphate synthetase
LEKERFDLQDQCLIRLQEEKKKKVQILAQKEHELEQKEAEHQEKYVKSDEELLKSRFEEYISNLYATFRRDHAENLQEALEKQR